MVQILRIVEDALARVASDDPVILANFLKHLRTNANLANLANLVTGGGDADTAAEFANTLVARKQIRRNWASIALRSCT